MDERIKKIRRIVEDELSCAAHQLDHVYRVFNMCMYLAKGKSVNKKVLEVAALLHDIARMREYGDKTGNTDHAELGAKMARKILNKLEYSKAEINAIRHCIESHRYRTGVKPETLEAKILFDADKLDVIGAIGIARSYMLAGQYKQKLYIDTALDRYCESNQKDGDKKGRIKDMSKHAPNIEFELKTKSLGNKLYTLEARKIAKVRIKYMRNFFKKLRNEIKGSE